MTSQLQHILDLIRQSEQLSTADKAALEKAVKEADKAFEITNFKLDRTEKVKRTTAVLLEETIAELEQKRKAVEVQNRELEIETALERVRSRTMAMHKSDELREVVAVMYQQMEPLGFATGGCELILCNEQTSQMEYWHTNPVQVIPPERYGVPKSIDPFFEQQWNAWKEGMPGLVLKLEGTEKRRLDNLILEQTDFKKIPEETKQWILGESVAVFSLITFKYGLLEAIDVVPLSQDKLLILQRFANVFEQTYTRFLDLQKAEAQAREAQIEAALERVRSKSMAMHKSDELLEAGEILFSEMQKLGIDSLTAGFVLMDKEEKNGLNYTPDPSTKKIMSLPVIIPHNETIHMQRVVENWKKGISHYVVEMDEEETIQHQTFIAERSTNFTLNAQQLIAISPARLFLHNFYFKEGYLLIVGGTRLSAEQIDIMLRFAKVFQQTYTRFLDLQKAEAQAREAQIEAALERIRSSAMAMHSSDGILEVTQVLREQIAVLGEKELESIVVNIYHEDTDQFEAWYSYRHPENTEKQIRSGRVMHSWSLTARARADKEKYYEEASDYTLVADYKMLKEWYEILLEVVPEAVEVDADGKPLVPDVLYYNYSKIAGGTLLLITNSEASDHSKYLLRRAAVVFNLAYSRFLDLQKAEAQAREAQIEAALERVRSRTMAMQKSEDLHNVVKVLHTQLKELDFRQGAAAIMIMDSVTGDIDWWMEGFDSGYDLPEKYHVPYFDHRAHQEQIMHWKSGTPYAVVEIAGQDKKSFDNYYFFHTDFFRVPETTKQFMMQQEAVSFSMAFMGYGALFWSPSPISDEQSKLLQRFAKVFEQSYTRFIDLQKAEAQAKESQIQLALERVRARTMAMQRSDELAEAAQLLYQQFHSLGIKTYTCAYMFIEEEQNLQRGWTVGSDGTLLPNFFDFPLTGDPILDQRFQSWKNKQPIHEAELQGEANKQHHTFLVSLQPPEFAQHIVAQLPDQVFFYNANFLHGYLFIINIIPLTTEEKDIAVRFAKVFEQTYTRFLDLQKAEAQVREAQIEAALERVRSRSMAMHKSEELRDVIQLVFEQLVLLNFDIDSAQFDLNYKESDDLTVWTAIPGQPYPSLQHIPYTDTAIMNSVKQAKEKELDFFSHTVTFEEKNEFFRHFFKHVSSPVPEERKNYIFDKPAYARSVVFLNNIFLGIQNYSGIPYSETENSVLRRFGKVFEQSYTRFLDLQKAEAQAREAQIEAALERVRSRTMGMQKSEDLREVVKVLYAQLKELGFQQGIAAINIMDNDSGDVDSWSEGFEDGYDLPEKYHLPYFEHRGLLEIFRHWKSGTPYAVVEIAGEDKKSLDNYYFFHTDFIRVPETTKQFMMQQDAILFSMAYMQYGALTWSPSPISDEQSKILQRFAKVFEQTYTRFLDLQKAEAQAREAQIEASLERVRGKAMAMHSSEDLTATISAFYHELELFSITPRRCGVGLLDKETHMAELSTMNTTEQGESIEVIGRLKMTGHPVLEGVFDNWLLQKEYHPVLRGNEIKEYYQLIRQNVAFPEYPNDAIQYGYFFFFVEGGVYAWTEKPLSEDELKIYRRFTTVLSLTYKRYKDLKDAEVREQEAIKQAALDRVRADIASMRNTADLDRITPLIWKELTTLGIPFIRCGVFIMDDKENKVHTYLSTPDGRAIAAYHTPMDDSGSLAGAIDHWRQQKVFVTHWVESDFQSQAEVLLKQGSITSREQYLNTLPKGGFHLHFLPFRQGMLYVGSHESLPSEVLQLVQSLADAFSVAYARYEDFTKLELAKAQIEKTLTDLKQTQTQLIQSEKMASLGELTAGIAHEIQNPLNFVNNFSELNTELIDELRSELAAGNRQSAEEIANDIKSNSEKINHHGKRADGIVKSMLQHSRKSNNQKELTDINALCDEYLRLSYHGLRAKDKSFNAKFEIQCDPELPNLNVLPQDVGRVILNLINNAFYAVSERQKVESETLTESGKPKAESLKSSVDKYEPKVTVTTKYLGDKVEIRVKDNGTGIPAKVKEKIFQPFFTTKPTGQGTGLGLSLSYDIITKGHGGEIKMETKEGEGSEFTIVLPV